MIIKNLKKPKYPSVDEHINTWGYIHTYNEVPVQYYLEIKGANH